MRWREQWNVAAISAFTAFDGTFPNLLSVKRLKGNGDDEYIALRFIHVMSNSSGMMRSKCCPTSIISPLDVSGELCVSRSGHSVPLVSSFRLVSSDTPTDLALPTHS